MGHGNLKPVYIRVFDSPNIKISICSSSQLSCSKSSLILLSCSEYSLGHLWFKVHCSSELAVLSIMSLVLSFFQLFNLQPYLSSAAWG